MNVPGAEPEDRAPSEFLIDLAERIANLCIQSHFEEVTHQAVSLQRPDADAPDRYCRFQSVSGNAPALVRAEVTLYTPDGNVRALGAIEADIIRLAISRYGGRISEVARRLNIGRSTLYRKLDELGIAYARSRS